MLEAPTYLDSPLDLMSHLRFHSGLQVRSSLPWAMDGYGYRRIHECHQPRPRPCDLPPPKASLRSKQGAFDRISRSRPGIFSACLSERKPDFQTLQGFRKEIRFLHSFFLPRERFGKQGVGIFAMHAFKRFQKDSTYAGFFRLQIGEAFARKASPAAQIEPFGYWWRCRKVVVQEYHSGAILWWFQRLSTKPFEENSAGSLHHEPPHLSGQSFFNKIRNMKSPTTPLVA